MPYPMSVAHRKCKFNVKNKFKLCRFLYNLCNTYIRTDMLAVCLFPQMCCWLMVLNSLGMSLSVFPYFIKVLVNSQLNSGRKFELSTSFNE